MADAAGGDPGRHPRDSEGRKPMIDNLIRERFGNGIDPLDGVPAEHIDEARRVVALWSEAGRADLRALPKIMKGDAMPDWKRAVLAKTLAARILSSSGRVREAALIGLGAVHPDFDRRALL
jgi:hypothetical protein